MIWTIMLENLLMKKERLLRKPQHHITNVQVRQELLNNLKWCKIMFNNNLYHWYSHWLILPDKQQLVSSRKKLLNTILSTVAIIKLISHQKESTSVEPLSVLLWSLSLFFGKLTVESKRWMHTNICNWNQTESFLIRHKINIKIMQNRKQSRNWTRN